MNRGNSKRRIKMSKGQQLTDYYQRAKLRLLVLEPIVYAILQKKLWGSAMEKTRIKPAYNTQLKPISTL